MKRLLIAAALGLSACSQQGGEAGSSADPAVSAARAPAAAAAQAAQAPKGTDVPAGTYTLDKTHASLIFRVDHLGMSNYTARFKRFDAQLQLDPKNPSASQVTATIDPRSLETDFPLPEPDFNAELLSKNWLDAAQFPEITFRSTRVEMTGPDTARIVGDLRLHGVTRPVTLEAKFNGGYAGMEMDPAGSRIGFSAKGTFNRSEFGVAYGVPAPGSTMGVSDAVEVLIEAEFTRPRQG